MARRLQRHPDLDGVVASSDLTVNRAMRALHASGQSVPADISVVGFDDVVIKTTSDPTLTTIRQPLEDVGRVAAETVVAVVTGHEVERQPILPARLVQRESA
ncbi:MULTISPECIES: substrate-binding domain-containing protein [unclassified Rathayibacter]|uniref:substrate-binding domain-containing protein n=1 Tax=unclassified Rathayibacter TaxID=2609250 RepID=UPI00104EA212|nr:MULTISPECIES: substrate-binding domain-containing protein [unclassified Rathayibacter]TCL79543.1 substrate-binding family protein [Rathayibacter sp. PhB192]TCM25188.1 substrate-binding family protein [Rathayibacter sp. PhB179]